VIGEARGLGVTSCLARRANILDCSKPTGIENLFIFGAGARASKPAELLASSDFASLLKEAIVHFDRVVIDSAPISAVSDTQLIGKEIDSACLVVRAHKTPRRAVVRALSLLAEATCDPDGIVFNKIERYSRDGYYFSEYAGEYARAGALGA
jgi:capsular exopolysaccharide synthesis family protein